MDFAFAARSIPIELISGRGHYERVIDAVLNARVSVWIATANLKELYVETRARRRRGYQSVLKAFDELANKGVELRILHASLPSRPFRDELDRHPALIRGGLKLRSCARVHLKAVIVDGSFVYLGSANWTGAGLGAKGAGRRNFELGIGSEDEGLLDQVQALYQRLWTGGECRGCKLRSQCEAPLDLEVRSGS